MRDFLPRGSELPPIKTQVQVNAPFGLLWEHYLPLFLEEGLNPEIGLDGASLDRFTRREFALVADRFHQAGRSITLHGPFQDLLPGALDTRMLAATRTRLQDAFELLEIFQPRSIVCHIGFEARHYSGVEDLWLANSVATWLPLAEQAARTNTLVALENVYETQPGLIKQLFAHLAAPNVMMCLDVGHLQAFGGGDFQEWLDLLGGLVGQLHLHDNHGSQDDHLALGRGVVPLPQVLAFFAGRNQAPLVTLEPHHERSLLPSLEFLAANWPW